MKTAALYDEKELCVRIANDDMEAYELVFRHYFFHLYESLLKYTQRHMDVEDIVQHTFSMVWEKRQTLPEIEHFDKWLYTIALNKYRSTLRRNKISDQYKQYLKETFVNEFEDADEKVIRSQKQSLLKKALEGLTPKQLEAYLLSREEGLTYAEIAERMQIGITTVKEHIHRAIKHIRNFILQNSDSLFILLWAIETFF